MGIKMELNRKETTKLLSQILEKTRLSGFRKYYAKEVSLDYGTKDVKRIDYLQFVPPSTTYISDIEKGYFITYEIKSCKEDVYSGNGLNFICEKNYIVTTMQCYKDLLSDINSGKLQEHIKNTNPENKSNDYGIMVAIPESSDKIAEFDNPTPFSNDVKWKFITIKNCFPCSRKRSITELLFLMLRSGK